MVALIHLLFHLQMLCNQPHIPRISFWPGKFGSQTLQFTITIYAVTANPIVSPFVVILFGCCLYMLALVEIALDIAVEMVRASDGHTDQPHTAQS